MNMTVGSHEPITASENEQPVLRQMKGVLNVDYAAERVPQLVGPSGEVIKLPESVFYVLRQVVQFMMRGKAVTIVPVNKELTTQEAADILNVSRPYLVKLLEEGKIPYGMVGTHRRIRFSDLMEYKRQREAERSRRLTELAQMSEDLGLYDS
jgi:excisionase family DNA binding protein